MHALGVVDLKVYWAQTNHGYSIPAQSYDFCPHLKQLHILDFTLSLIQLVVMINLDTNKCDLEKLDQKLPYLFFYTPSISA